MRIIGGRDYYDHGLSFGVEEGVVFVRTGRIMTQSECGLPAFYGKAPQIKLTGEEDVRPQPWRRSREGREWLHQGVQYLLEGASVIFCGKYYGGARVWKYEIPVNSSYRGARTFDRSDKSWTSETFWDQNSLGKFLATRGARIGREHAPHNSRWTKPFARGKLEREVLDACLRNNVSVATRYSDLTQKVGSSGEAAWSVNSDDLRRYDFFKITHPMEAFQELSMWVGGVLSNSGNPMVQITDDKIKIAKHGMDKWSFRKMGKDSR